MAPLGCIEFSVFCRLSGIIGHCQRLDIIEAEPILMRHMMRLPPSATLETGNNSMKDCISGARLMLCFCLSTSLLELVSLVAEPVLDETTCNS